MIFLRHELKPRVFAECTPANIATFSTITRLKNSEYTHLFTSAGFSNSSNVAAVRSVVKQVSGEEN